MTSRQWRPTASISQLKTRAHLIAQIREFFAQRNVWEVDTPSFSQAAVTDVHLESFSTLFRSPTSPEIKTLYLQTSPEFAMKRLLASGSGCIYQIAKVFRNDESGRYHNPEFSLLEWYRVGFDHWQLMNEIDQLLQLILQTNKAEQLSYQQAFIDTLLLDPLSATLKELQSCCAEQGFADIAQQEENKDTLLQLLFSHCIEHKIGQATPCFIYDFPASQAALAKLSVKDPRVAERFEVYFKGIELANGFHELTDAQEQLTRFEQDNQLRQAMGLEMKPIDMNLIAALEQGLPQCAGVALGIDRLLMLALQQEHIDQVIAFPTSIA